MEEKLYKFGDKVPQAGKYECLVCGFVVEYLPKHIEHGAVFNICPVCMAGTEGGPKDKDEEFWKFIN